MRKNILKLLNFIFGYKGFGFMCYALGIYEGIRYKNSMACVVFMGVSFIIWGKGWIEELEGRIKKLENENENLKRRFNMVWEDFMYRK